MARPKKREAAAEADWSFMDNTDVLAALDQSADRLSKKWNLDRDDCYQELCLYLSVRPEIWKDKDGGFLRWILNQRFKNAIKNEGEKEKRRSHESYDDWAKDNENVPDTTGWDW